LVLLRALGAQLGLALDGLLLYEEAQRNIRENRALYQQTQANLREIERLNYQLTGRAWSDYLRVQPEAAALTLDLNSGQATSEAEWTPTLNEAAKHHQVITITQSGRRVLSLPIIVRNEAVGAMEFELDSEDPLPDEVFDLVQSVGQRLGSALENRRLFDETQRVAQREALINDIGTELQTATGVDAIIQQTARQLQETLAAEQITIRLGKSEGDRAAHTPPAKEQL
jgi:GAF domain-containing protein